MCNRLHMELATLKLERLSATKATLPSVSENNNTVCIGTQAGKMTFECPGEYDSKPVIPSLPESSGGPVPRQSGITITTTLPFIQSGIHTAESV